MSTLLYTVMAVLVGGAVGVLMPDMLASGGRRHVEDDDWWLVALLAVVAGGAWFLFLPMAVVVGGGWLLARFFKLLYAYRQAMRDLKAQQQAQKEGFK
jgi:hypothetical protein